MRESGEIFLITRNRFEVLFGNLDYSIEDIGFEFLQLFFIVGLNHSVNLAKGFAQLGIEMIFDTIVGSESILKYLPSSLEPMMAHLLPSSL